MLRAALINRISTSNARPITSTRIHTHAYDHGAISDGHKAVTHIRKPARGGQNLSERYIRLEKSLRGKQSFSKELEDLVHPISNASPPSKSDRKTPQLFHGFVIPEEPKLPADDECCMSGCAVCVYDLYEESLEAYQDVLSNLRANLSAKNVPEFEWPLSVQNKSSTLSAGGDKRKDAILNAFEEMERALEAKKQNAESGATPVTSPKSLTAAHKQKRNQLMESMKDAPRDTLFNELYQGLRWIVFSGR